MKLLSAALDLFDKVSLSLEDKYFFDNSDIRILNGENTINIKYNTEEAKGFTLMLEEPINIKYKSRLFLKNLEININYSPFYKSQEFNNRFYYEEKLGAEYSPTKTIFKLWSPVATWVKLILYKSGEFKMNSSRESFEMRENNGVWSVTIDQNLEGYFYNYQINAYGNIEEATDPYAVAAGVNGERGGIIDLLKTNPAGWTLDKCQELSSFNDAIIYEASVRDITMAANSGVVQRGKYLGLAEANTTNSHKLTTGLAHIIELGVTHIQLMPIFDFSKESVDEAYPSLRYNWGYNPENYNVPEGSYSTNPYNPKVRIKELKELIKVLHNNNISVNMDVVFNHTAGEKDNNLEKIFPGYYYRLKENGEHFKGSGCENDTASEHLMVRRLIVDSVLYWAEEYHIDGFRFDLMGLHDIATMNIIREKLNNIRKGIMVYGEGWNLDTGLPREERAIQANASRMSPIGFFNDSIRDTIKGNVFDIYSRGFSSGNMALAWELREYIAGGKYDNPEQSINYFSAHDNNTLWDKIEASNREYTLEQKKSIVKLSYAIILTSQGIPFLHSGEEFCRTKLGIQNSYKSSDYINNIDWDRKSEFSDVFHYCKGLIELRKTHRAFRINLALEIREHLYFYENLPDNTLMFTLKDHANGDLWESILVIYYSGLYQQNITLPPGKWNIVATPQLCGTDIIGVAESNISLSEIGAFILFQ